MPQYIWALLGILLVLVIIVFLFNVVDGVALIEVAGKHVAHSRHHAW